MKIHPWDEKWRPTSDKIGNPLMVVISYAMKCCHICCQKTCVSGTRLKTKEKRKEMP